jgi:hypothetical protein
VGREASRGGVRRLLTVDPFLLFAVLGVFFPWVTGPGLSRSGLDQDGVGILALAAGTYLLARARIRWSWIPAAVGAVAAIRTVVITLGTPTLSVGPGLWMSSIGLAVAAVWLFARELAHVRDMRRRPPSQGPAG